MTKRFSWRDIIFHPITFITVLVILSIFLVPTMIEIAPSLATKNCLSDSQIYQSKTIFGAPLYERESTELVDVLTANENGTQKYIVLNKESENVVFDEITGEYNNQMYLHHLKDETAGTVVKGIVAVSMLCIVLFLIFQIAQVCVCVYSEETESEIKNKK